MEKALISAAILIASTLAYGCNSSQQQGAAKPMKPQVNVEDRTGVCFRRIEGPLLNGSVNSRYEVILAVQSSDLNKDMARISEAENVKGFITSPDLVPDVWHHAWLSDRLRTSADGPDCSNLPAIKPQ